jgi:diguanylate cyclase (GGDEF)-like protein/PAS domain S-box-containing protein
LSTVAREYAAHGAIDDALVQAAAAAEVGLVQVHGDGTVWWSDETYRLHGRPRWVRVRSLDDLAWGLAPNVVGRVRTAYTDSLTDPDVDLRYAATGEHGPDRDLVLKALGRGVLVVHRATSVVDIREADAAVDDPEVTAAQEISVPEPTEADEPAPPVDDEQALASAVLKATPDLVLLYDIGSRRVLTMAGNDSETAAIVDHMGTSGGIRDDVHPDDYPMLSAWRDGLRELEPGEVRHMDARFRVDGEWRWREIRASEFRRSGTATDEVVLVIRDVHQRVEAGRRIAESERAFREVFDASPVGLAVLDANGRFTDVNDAFCRLAGRTREAVLATVYEALLHPEDRAAAVISRARTQSQSAAQTAAERRLTRADGASIWVRVRTSDIDYAGDARTLVSIEDVSASKATEDQLRHDAMHDELTGLPNRRLLVDRLERALTRSRRSGTRLAIYFIDLDDLKRVNDTHPWSHRAGDVLLTSTAAAVRATLREADTLGRLGGDEFVAICEDVGDDSTITDLGDRILVAVRRPITIGNETVAPSASIGVAVADDDTETAEHLLRRADAAMYAAKTSGGSRVVRADAQGDEAPIDLVGALSRRELRLHYQPVVSLLSGAVLGVTTVIKWRHPERGMLPATEVRAAIGAGASSLPVVHWAIDRAISDVRTVAPGRVEHVSVWIPIPGRAALAASTRSALAKSFAGPDGTLTPESAPSVVLDVHEQDVASLTKRRAMHHHLDSLLHEGPLALGVERFTADAVPVGTLQLLGAASVSIDPELLVEAAENEATEELVRSLVTGATALGVIAIAMDVESQEQLDLARALGIHAAYGDLIGPPAPLDTYSDLLHGGRMALPETPVGSESVEAVDVGRSVSELLADADAADTQDAVWSRLSWPDPTDAPTPSLAPPESPTEAPAPTSRSLPPDAAPRSALRSPGSPTTEPRREPPRPARPDRAATAATGSADAGPVIDAPPPSTPRVDLGDDIGASLAAELGIDLPPLPEPDVATAAPSLQERLRAARRRRPADGGH